MDFEWDPRKAKANRDKHGVEFEVARNVFHDPARVINLDDRSGDEERWQTIGLASGKVLFVVYSERDNDVIRIISARKASRREEREYLDQATP
jgi:uncharacterized DUF497 family protein